MKEKSFTLYVLYDPRGQQTWRCSRSKKDLIRETRGPMKWSEWYANGWRIKKAKCTIIE